MKKLIISLSVLLLTSFAINAQINDVSGYYAQTLNLQEHTLTSAQLESMLSLPTQQYGSYDYKQSTQWKVGMGFLIGGGVCLGATGISFVALACSSTLDDFFANSIIFAYSLTILGSVGGILMVTGGIMMGCSKSNYASATFDLGGGPSYAQLGLTRTGNLGLSLTF